MGQLAEILIGISLPEGANALIAEADRLLAERPQQAAYVQYLESEVKRLRSKSGETDISAGLTFDAITGTYAGVDELRYCARCLTKDAKRSPLQNGKHGWKCPVCGGSFRDPARPVQPINYGPSGGSWMA